MGEGGTRVPAWGIVGDFAAVAELVSGRWPGPGEALVAATAKEKLGFVEPFGWVRQPGAGAAQYNVVGEFRPRDPFGEFGAGLIYHAGTASATQLSVILRRASDAAAAQ